jgi:kumamolisin
MLAFIAFALQSAFAATVHSGYSNDPNIVVPDSSALHWYDTKQVHTAYLVYKGPDPRPSSEPPPAANLYGPLIPFLPAGYHPSDIRTAYNITLNGSQAIAVVDFYHLATALTDFNTFSSTFGLPQETSTNSMASTNQVFQVVFQHPGIVPAVNQDWNGEEALDIEWTHAMAPNAKIYVVESDDGNLPACAAIAAALPGVKDVSCSFVWYYESLGATELQLDPDFTQPGVVFFASSGDLGGVPGWPSESPNVVSVGGTSLFMNSSNTSVLAETGWAGSGGGPSAYESRPAFQSSLASRIGPHRADPDISAIADPDTGVGIYTTSTLPADFGSGPWYVIGGTSLSSPVVAGIVNTTETWYPDSQAENGLIYSLLGTSKLRDIVFGSAGSFSDAARLST